MNELHREIAAAHASIEELAEEKRDEIRERVATLLGGTDGRVQGIWDRAGADINATPKAFNAVPVGERDDQWTIGFSAVIAASQWQAYLEIMGPELIRKTGKYGPRVTSAAMSLSLDELKTAAKDGTPASTFAEEKLSRKTRTVVSNGSVT